MFPITISFPRQDWSEASPPPGEGETIKKALASVSKLSPSQLPMIPGYPNAPESWRRVAALHRELLRLCRHNIYFMSCRDAAQVLPGLSYQAVSNINHALERLGVIKVVHVGDPEWQGVRVSVSSRGHYDLC